MRQIRIAIAFFGVTPRGGLRDKTPTEHNIALPIKMSSNVAKYFDAKGMWSWSLEMILANHF
jgi:hypothetical protein